MNVLIVTYDWLPRNSIATHRPYSWAKYWSRLGCNVTVLTAKKKFYDMPLDLDLPQLEDVKVCEFDYTSLIPVSNSVGEGRAPIITGALKKAKALVSSILGWEYDVRSNWGAGVDRMIEQLGGQFDVIISTYGPDSAHKIASKFKKSYPGIYWVADYRDLWSLNARKRDSKLIRSISKKSELKVVRDADMFTTVSDELAFQLASLVNKDPVVVYNGFDISVDAGNFNKPAAENTKKSLHIVYTGRIYVGKRSPLALVSALENLIDQGYFLENQVFLDFYGVNTRVIDEELKLMKYPEIVKHHGHVSRDIALMKQKEADLLLLLESGDEDSKGFLTGKIFEYIASGTPILSVGSKHDSAIGRILKETRCGMCYENSVSDLERDLINLRNGIIPDWFSPDIEAINNYSRVHQAERMLAVINSRLPT